MNSKILFVDDEPNVLEAFQRSLRKDFEISVAAGGEQALEVMKSEGPFALVVSDMRMPRMDGVEFLARVKEIAPDTVRIMLTGNAEQQTAIAAVNEGNIFRFLTKPCPPETLARALNAGLEQFRLVSAEKLLLEQTLNKSLQVLVEILAIVNPTAFSRSTRVQKMARDIADAIGMQNAWQVEMAAMLSQIGCVTVPDEIQRKVASGIATDREIAIVTQHPQTARDLISRIPRMEVVAEIIAAQNYRMRDEDPASSPEVTLGGRILKTVLDYDREIAGGRSPHTVLRGMSERHGWYDPHVLHILHNVIERTVGDYESFQLGIDELRPGMFLGTALTSSRGSVLLPAGLEINRSLLLRLQNLFQSGIIPEKITVNVPVDDAKRFSMEAVAAPNCLPETGDLLSI